MNKLYVTAEVKTHINNVNEVSGLLSKLASDSLAESGCLHYQILKSTEQTDTFSTFEI